MTDTMNVDGQLIYVDLPYDPLEELLISSPSTTSKYDDCCPVDQEEQSSYNTPSADRLQRFTDVIDTTLRDYYHLPARKVIQKLNISRTIFNKLLKYRNISRWPYRRFEAFSIMREYVQPDDAFTLRLIQEEETKMRTSLRHKISLQLELFYRKVKRHRSIEIKLRNEAQKDGQLPRRSTCRLRQLLEQEAVGGGPSTGWVWEQQQVWV